MHPATYCDYSYRQRDSVQHLHEECYGGEDATRVERMVHLLLGWICHCCINYDPPACEEQNSRDNRSHSIPPLPPVNAFAIWPAEVIQKASHLQPSSCPPPFLSDPSLHRWISPLPDSVCVNTCFTCCSSKTASCSASDWDQWLCQSCLVESPDAFSFH